VLYSDLDALHNRGLTDKNVQNSRHRWSRPVRAPLAIITGPRAVLYLQLCSNYHILSICAVMFKPSGLVAQSVERRPAIMKSSCWLTAKWQHSRLDLISTARK